MIVVMYTIIGIIGGMAYEPFFTTDENLFSKINSSGSKIGQATVVAYPLVLRTLLNADIPSDQSS